MNLNECEHSWVKIEPECTGSQPNSFRCKKCGLVRTKIDTTDATKAETYYYQSVVVNTLATS